MEVDGMSVADLLRGLLGYDRLYPWLEPSKLHLRTCVVGTSLLTPHEDVDRTHLDLVEADIARSGYVKFPLVVDVRTFIVLDGHHRLEALKELGIRYAPVFFVDYAESYVDVYPFRKDIRVSKTSVVVRALVERSLYPPKTTKHVYHGVSVLPTFTPLELLETPHRYSRALLIAPDVVCYGW